MLDRVSRACLAVRFTAKNGDSWGWKNLRELNFHRDDGQQGAKKTPKSVRKHVSCIDSKSEKVCGTAFLVNKICGKSASIRASFLGHLG